MKANARGIFLTGVTGVLGRELVSELLLKTEAKIYLLIRGRKNLSHVDRARKILASKGLDKLVGTRVQVMEGDITLPLFGLSPDDHVSLARDVTHFFHVAALTALNGSERDCNQVNLGGTREALKIAALLREKGCLERFYYYSTAFVAGSLQTYCSLEDELPREPSFANFYESSKYASENEVRAALAGGLPATIFRPSIVVGDSKTGEVSEFNVIYPFMKLFAHGILKRLPTRLDNSFNIVPIDFVTNASVHIAFLPESVGKTYHLVTRRQPTIEMLINVAAEEYPQLPSIEIIDPEEFSKEELGPNEQFVFGMLEPYLGYLNDHLTFDTRNTEAALKGSGLAFPETDLDFLRRLIQYAVEAGYLVVQ